ncbi:MAG: PH domain-containing protein [Nitrospirae bacterium]|nr:MAG: PH domain-containing protein [Nitrospirota bacterium]
MDNERERILFRLRISRALFLVPLFFFFLSVFALVLSFVALTATPDNPPNAVRDLLILGGTFCVTPFFFLTGIVALARVLAIFTTTHLYITQYRIVAKTGFLRKQVLEIRLPQLESIQVKQGILGRLFDFGTLEIAGSGGTHGVFYGVKRPNWARNWIIQAAHRMREGQ